MESWLGQNEVGVKLGEVGDTHRIHRNWRRIGHDELGMKLGTPTNLSHAPTGKQTTVSTNMLGED
jgi:hypothetical protein